MLRRSFSQTTIKFVERWDLLPCFLNHEVNLTEVEADLILSQKIQVILPAPPL